MRRLLLAVIVLACATFASASEIITYTYDANGRLVTAAHTGSVNNNLQAQYTLDPADNRNHVVVSGAIPAPTASLSAAPTIISLGGSSTLTYKCTNSTSGNITPTVGGVIADGSSHTTSVSPTANTTYTLSCAGAGGMATAPAMVTLAPTASLTPATQNINLTGWASLTYQCTNSTSGQILPTIGGVLADGSPHVAGVGPSSTTTYTLTCTGAGGSANASATVVQTGNPSTATAALTPASQNINSSGAATLTYQCVNTTTGNISPTVGGVVSDGSPHTATVSPTFTTTYTLTCQGPSGTATASALVYGMATLTPATQNINLTGWASLVYRCVNSTSGQINPTIGGVVADGASHTAGVGPSSTTTYALTCIGTSGSATAPATVVQTGNPSTATASLSASPTTIHAGASSTLTYQCTNTTTGNISPTVGGVPSDGAPHNATVSPTSTTAYTLTCKGPNGTATSSATVTVS